MLNKKNLKYDEKVGYKMDARMSNNTNRLQLSIAAGKALRFGRVAGHVNGNG